MSAPVDVLKAMRAAEAYCYDAGASSAAKNLRAAADAVAELIKAATSARDQLRDAAKELRWLSANQAMHCEAISDHVDAALASAQGVQP